MIVQHSVHDCAKHSVRDRATFCACVFVQNILCVNVQNTLCVFALCYVCVLNCGSCRYGGTDDTELEDEEMMAQAGEQEELATRFELPKWVHTHLSAMQWGCDSVKMHYVLNGAIQSRCDPIKAQCKQDAIQSRHNAIKMQSIQGTMQARCNPIKALCNQDAVNSRRNASKMQSNQGAMQARCDPIKAKGNQDAIQSRRNAIEKLTLCLVKGLHDCGSSCRARINNITAGRQKQQDLSRQRCNIRV